MLMVNHYSLLVTFKLDTRNLDWVIINWLVKVYAYVIKRKNL